MSRRAALALLGLGGAFLGAARAQEPPPLIVQLHMVVPPGDTAAQRIADEEQRLAETIFRNKAKITLRARIRQARGDFGTGCHDLAAIGRLDADHEPRQINIYFVRAVVLRRSGASDQVRAGMNCREPGAPNVIFISLSYVLPTTLAHEIGHALSLEHTGVGNWVFPGFDKINIMYNGLDVASTKPRRTLTFGQVFRAMNDIRSWVNTPVQGQPAIRTGPTRDCSATQSDCPPLDQARPQR